MAEHNAKDEYNKRMPVSVATPKTSGYPNKVSNTQTVKTRGSGAAIKGTRSSSKLG